MNTTPTTRRTNNKRHFLSIVVIVLAVGGALGYFWMQAHAKGDPNSKLMTATVTRGDLIETVSATGSVTAQTGAEVKIGSQVTGRIRKLNADVGSHVNAGDVIAELDLPDTEAQRNQAQANLAAAQTKLAQTQSGVSMERMQTSGAVVQATALLNSARAKLASAEAAAKQQDVQTPADIKKAETALVTAQAALETAKSNLAQVQAGANLQIATAQEQWNQAQANAKNSSVNLMRQQTLLAKGFVAASDVDTAQAQTTVNQSQVDAAQENIELIKQKVDADLKTAQNQVTQAKQGVESAQAALDAARAETSQNAAKQADIKDAIAQVGQAQAGLDIAQGNRSQDVLKDQDVTQARDAAKAAQEQVAYNQAQVDKTLIRSPISGTVLQLAAQQGETLAAGLSAPTLIVVADLDRLQVDAFVDETDIGKVRLGQEADITVDAFPKRVFKGKITKIASGSTIQQGVVTYDVTIALGNTNRQLKPDMTASVTIQTGHKADVLLAPTEAVKMGKNGSTVSVLVKKDGKTTVETRKVKTGGSDGVNTEIRDGLQENDTLVLAGASQSGQRPQGGTSPFGPGGGNRGGGGGGGGGGGRR